MAQEFITNALLLIGIVLGPISLIGLTVWFSINAFQGLWRQWKRTRQIQTMPCYRCAYFSGREELKCAVNPYSAFTQAAKECQDFTPSKSPQQVTFWYYKL